MRPATLQRGARPAPPVGQGAEPARQGAWWWPAARPEPAAGGASSERRARSAADHLNVSKNPVPDPWTRSPPSRPDIRAVPFIWMKYGFRVSVTSVFVVTAP